MFKLFPKKERVEEQEVSAKEADPEGEKPRIMSLLSIQFAKAKFYFYMLLCVYLVIQCCVLYYLYTQKIAEDSIESDQSVMVNVITDEMTLGFSPYASDLEGWIDQAVDKGYEVMLNLPMQPIDYQTNDPGAYAMLQNLDKDQNLERLENLLSYSKKIIGVYSLQNEVFSSTKSNMSDIVDRLAADHLILLYGNKKNQDDIKDLCKHSSLECLSPNIAGDTELNEAKIYKKLKLLESDALKNGYAVGYLNGYPVAMRALKKWAQQLDSNKLILTTVSSVLDNANPSNKEKEN